MKKSTVLLSALLLLMLSLGFNQAKASGPIVNITPVNYIRCSGDTGTALANASGGTAPYTYSWAPSGGTNATGTSLSAGSYTVTVTDNMGQTATASVIMTQPTVVTATINAPTNNNSCTAPDGSVGVTAAGGTPSYTYLWMPGGQTTATATKLAAYTYTVKVADAYCCTATASVTITGPAAPILTLSSTADTNSCDGTVSASVTGGVSPFTYLWSPGGKTTASVSGLCAGTYCCAVTDHSGCKDSTCVQVHTSTQHNCCLCSQGPPLGIASLEELNSGVFVYPNPNKGQFTISATSEELRAKSGVEIYNMLGEKVYSAILPQTPEGALNKIDLSNQPNGIYLYRVISEDGSLVGEGKLIIQK
jgi:hypothetical protein